MAAGFDMARLEGGAGLLQDDEGRIRITGAPTRRFEQRLQGRTPLEAVILTQQISAGGGVSHALSALAAWESATNIPVAENGRMLREALHALSLLHAHVRHFYLQALPDYLPENTLAEYTGTHPSLLRLRAGTAKKPKSHWTRWGFKHPFTLQDIRQLWENRARAVDTLDLLGRMMAVIGGKFPVAMSLVPGGVNLTLTRQTLFRLRAYLGEVRDFLRDTAYRDALLVVQRHPGLKTLGRGGQAFLSAGSGEEESSLDSGHFPSGVLMAEQLEPFAPVATESIRYAFYQVARRDIRSPLPAVAPGKAGAYSWIKAPRYQGRPMETGAMARLMIGYLSGVRSWRPEIVEEVQNVLGVPLTRANTVGGRMLARMGELGGLIERVSSLLDQIDPAHPTVSEQNGIPDAQGEGSGYVEAPAGTSWHRAFFEHGRIAHYDIVSPSTWNGSPSDEADRAGPMETALNREDLVLSNSLHRLSLSRIVHSFAFSMSDAVH